MFNIGDRVRDLTDDNLGEGEVILVKRTGNKVLFRVIFAFEDAHGEANDIFDRARHEIELVKPPEPCGSDFTLAAKKAKAL